DAGGADLGLKTALEHGLVGGPRMQISISMLSQTGGHGDGWLPSGCHLAMFPAYPGFPSTVVDGAGEVRRKVRELVRAGADVILAAERGVNVPDWGLRKAGEVTEAHVESFRRVVAAGVKVAMGTDSAVTPHGENLRELELMVEGGMSAEHVLVATTRTAAELL